MRTPQRSKGMHYTDISVLRTPELCIALIVLCGTAWLTDRNGWFAFALLGWIAGLVWWWWKLMRDAEVCIDDDGIVEHGVFATRRYVWSGAPTSRGRRISRPTRDAVLIGHRRTQRRGGTYVMLVVCCAGDPTPRPLRCARIGAMSNVLGTLAELAEAGYPVEYEVQSRRVWAADARSGLTAGDGRLPRLAVHWMRDPLP